MGWKNDFKYYLITSGKLHDLVPHFLARDQIPGSGYSSIFSVDGGTAQAIQQAGTTVSFKGVVWTDTLWIDTDSYEAADKVETILKEMGYGYVSYDSGGRGAHFGINLDTQPDHTLPYRCKAWVAEHFSGLADTSIYTHLHLFRLPGTHHERTGRAKELVGRYEGRALVLPRWQPRAQTLTPVVSNTNVSFFDNHRVIANLVPASNGERHYQLIRLIYALKDGQGLDATTATWVCSEWNKTCEEPKDEAAIEKAVMSIYR